MPLHCKRTFMSAWSVYTQVDRRSLLRQFLSGCDAAVLCGSYVLAYWICASLFERRLLSIADYIWVLWVIVPSWLVALRAFGLYHSAAYEWRGDLINRVI